MFGGVLLLLVAGILLAAEGSVNPCTVSPCQNGGTCIINYDYTGGYFCQCVEYEYYGPICAIPSYHACNSNPCLNYATCLNGYYDTYTCVCLEGWTGDLCQTIPSACVGFTACTHNGTCECYDGGCPDISCYCPEPQWQGELCDTYQPCGLQPCQNGGTCTPSGDDYTCDCSGTGYTGTNCTLGACDYTPCLNGGTCIPGGNQYEYSCECTDYYYGADCNTKEACMSSPCLNGGVCSNAGDTFICDCEGTGYSGHTCQTPD